MKHSGSWTWMKLKFSANPSEKNKSIFLERGKNNFALFFRTQGKDYRQCKPPYFDETEEKEANRSRSKEKETERRRFQSFIADRHFADRL